jgi:hypothetical protein
MIDALASRVQATFAPELPIVTCREEAKQPPFLLHVRWESGDIYSGVSDNHTLELQLMRPETELLRVCFQFSFHELSGQCDDWSLIVTGAKEAERAVFAELFLPRQYTGHWNNHIRPSFEFNGVESTYETR